MATTIKFKYDYSIIPPQPIEPISTLEIVFGDERVIVKNHSTTESASMPTIGATMTLSFIGTDAPPLNLKMESSGATLLPSGLWEQYAGYYRFPKKIHSMTMYDEVTVNNDNPSEIGVVFVGTGGL